MTFWYGLSFEDLANMRMPVLTGYLERLPARQAELKLLLVDAVSAPHMKENDRKSAINNWMRLASMTMTQRNPKPASQARLKILGIDVRHV